MIPNEKGSAYCFSVKQVFQLDLPIDSVHVGNVGGARDGAQKLAARSSEAAPILLQMDAGQRQRENTRVRTLLPPMGVFKEN